MVEWHSFDPRMQAKNQAENAHSRILVVDDHDGLRKLLTLVLERAGHDVISCADGPDALEALRIYPADLVLLDLGMPGMTGYEVVTALRVNPNTADLPVIFLTAHGETDDV